MSRERRPPNDPREWLNRAESDLRLATIERTADIYLDDLCFHAQQAAEKSIKAVMIYRDIRFPYIHDIGRLLELLIQGGVPIPTSIQEAVALSEYAGKSRYPGATAPVPPEALKESIRLATIVFD